MFPLPFLLLGTRLQLGLGQQWNIGCFCTYCFLSTATRCHKYDVNLNGVAIHNIMCQSCRNFATTSFPFFFSGHIAPKFSEQIYLVLTDTTMPKKLKAALLHGVMHVYNEFNWLLQRESIFIRFEVKWCPV